MIEGFVLEIEAPIASHLKILSRERRIPLSRFARSILREEISFLLLDEQKKTQLCRALKKNDEAQRIRIRKEAKRIWLGDISEEIYPKLRELLAMLPSVLTKKNSSFVLRTIFRLRYPEHSIFYIES